ncbi:MAG: histidine--tRNA ligase [Flavobacteriales bacterium]|nr:histidine--tRNA ligase [Flavobacteriales bacterium]|tara:strand:+ start:23964 stop:25313 length:1350 start_codon:yes stop_codon:yes gene_type:complete
MSTKKPSIPKGMRDFNSDVVQKRNYILETVKSAFERYGYAPIETPAMENIGTLTGKYGDEGDRLIFKILNSGDYLSKTDLNTDTNSKSLTKQIVEKALRYDLTVPFARFVVQNRNDITFPFKRYQMQNVWRADRPQKGRYREFYQCDADIIGTDSLICEVELVQLYDDVFSRLNIPNVDICINNRKVLSGMIELMEATEIFDDIVIIIDKLDKIGIEKVKEEMKNKGVKESSMSTLDTFLNARDISDLEMLLEQSEVGKRGLEELQFVMEKIDKIGLQSTNLVFDITLARGLNYYTGCILEVKANDVQLGSIGGGGRYDDLTSNFGLKDVSGVGVSFGIDRIYLVLEELELFPKNITISTTVMFVNFGVTESSYCLPLLKKLRLAGISSELYPQKAKMKKQMNYADNKGVKFVVLVGENEMDSAMLTVKDMNSGEQSELNINELIKKLS